MVTSQTRPYVLLSTDALKLLRIEAAPGGRRHASYVSFVKASADHWLSEPITIPPRSGYWHDFVCIDGTRLAAPQPPHLLADLTCATVFTCLGCGRSYSGPKIEGAFRAVEHGWLTNACRDLALAGAVEQRRDYLEKAAGILRKYADAYPGRHTSALQGGIFYQSLDESVNMISLAQAYDLVFDANVLTEAEKKHIERDLFWESAEGLVHMGLSGNWGSWHLSAVGVIGLATQHQRFIDYGIESFKSQIADQLGDDGLWPESVHTYHFYPMRGFLHLAEACANVGIDLYHWEARPGKGLNSMFMAPLHYMYPNFQLPAINDGWFRAFLPLDVYRIGYERYGDYELGWAVQQLANLGSAAKSDSPDAIDVWSVVHDTRVLQDGWPPPFSSTNFPVLGIACLRQATTPDAPDRDVMMTFDYGPFLSHGQPDKMGITFFANGQLLSADYGTCSYGSKLMPYYKSTQSHNTLRIDGRDQKHTKFGRLLGFKSAGAVQLACAETTEVCTGAMWRRAVVLTAQYGLVIDQIKADAEHQVDWLFHAEGDGVEFAGRNEEVSTETVGLTYFADTKRVYPEQFPHAMWTSGTQPILKLQIAATTATEWFSARCPAESALHQVPAVVGRQRGKDASFAAMMYAANSRDFVSSVAPKIVQESDGKFMLRGAFPAQVDLAADHLSFAYTDDKGKQVEVRAEFSSTPQRIGQTGIFAASASDHAGKEN